MDAILYAEVYFICIVLTGLLAIWVGRNETQSTADVWLRRTLVSFLCNFVANFLFTLCNRVCVVDALVVPLSYALKTLFFITLATGVFCWCGYAETLLNSTLFEAKNTLALLNIPLGIALAMPIVNLFTHWMFDFSETNAYQRHFLFHADLIFLFLASSVCGVRLFLQARREAVPSQRGHLFLTGAFPLCILAALVLSFAGEDVPVICVCIMVELQCIYMGATRHQISMDELTQVNNRQNLIGFMNYKLKNHSGDLFLLMIDLDEFKSINDSFGHLAGDQALVELAGVLKRCCGPNPKRPYIARYGGDEFIIVMEGTMEEVTALCAAIRGALEEINRTSHTYRLQVSIGSAAWREGMDHKALIAAADAELYKQKSEKKILR